jgi:hypothetical protein
MYQSTARPTACHDKGFSAHTFLSTTCRLPAADCLLPALLCASLVSVAA